MSDLGTETEKGKHSEYLSKLYELAKGSPREVDISEIRKELGLDIRQTQEIGLSLSAEGMITISAGEYIRLTNKGIEEVEKAQGPRQQRSWRQRLFGKSRPKDGK
jgi:Mn-dependent DtxR family transcriptional regulator